MKTLLLLLCSALSALAEPSWPLGTFTVNDGSNRHAPALDTNCPPGYVSLGFTIQCPDVQRDIVGYLAIGETVVTPSRGVVALFTGETGTYYWTDQGPEVAQMAEDFRALGFAIVQVKWASSWWSSSNLDRAGIARLGCRPSTVIDWIYHTYYLPLDTGRFTVAGNSGGSAQIGYALAYYGLSSEIDLAVMSGGPPFCVLDKSCMRNRGEELFWLNKLALLDKAWGFFRVDGPAALHDPDFIPEWQASSLAIAGNNYAYPATQVRFLLGDQDPSMQAIARPFYDRLASAGTSATWEVVPHTDHKVHESPDGREAIWNAITTP